MPSHGRMHGMLDSMVKYLTSIRFLYHRLEYMIGLLKSQCLPFVWFKISEAAAVSVVQGYIYIYKFA